VEKANSSPAFRDYAPNLRRRATVTRDQSGSQRTEIAA
jgi:hypothetical protein